MVSLVESASTTVWGPHSIGGRPLSLLSCPLSCDCSQRNRTGQADETSWAALPATRKKASTPNHCDGWICLIQMFGRSDWALPFQHLKIFAKFHFCTCAHLLVPVRKSRSWVQTTTSNKPRIQRHMMYEKIILEVNVLPSTQHILLHARWGECGSPSTIVQQDCFASSLRSTRILWFLQP